ncbi:MAG: cupredoxin domain-containing protein [Actinobacteria bacterium]|nr:cupredoxin domain-containing protein [Actinomycetota bacterium]MCA1722534.1 cupredoxin domain-containing protein [Actinomycetota bacterium]
MRASLLLTLPLVVGLSACGGSSGGSASSGGSDVAVTSSDSACEVATTQFDPGKIAFDVKNSGKDVTEVYVYGKGSDGDFDKVVGEVENIAPGTSRDFAVDVKSGEYEVACKPGQTGEGIRTKITVSGDPAAAENEADAKYDREVEVTAKEYAFTGLEGFTAKVGEKIEFKLENKGSTEHEFEVLGPDGKDVGEVGPTAPGKDGEVVLTLDKPGTYTYLCGIADHESRGMKGTFTVS